MFEFREPKPAVVKALAPIAAVGPAALFAFMWRWLNGEFAPYLSEGFDSPAECMIAGVLFWFWISAGIERSVDRKQTEGLVKTHVERVYWKLISVAVAIPFGRVLFSLVPPWDNRIGGILGLAFGHYALPYFVKGVRGRFIHSRGTLVLAYDQARARIAALPIGQEPRIRWAGFDLPGEIAEGNILCAGAIGAGKTRMHRELLRSVVPTIRADSDRRILIYDVKSDLVSELNGMDVRSQILVLNAFDKRSIAWDVAADIRTPAHARHFAEALILPDRSGQNAFFTRAARAIVAGVIEALNRSHAGDWTLRRLIHLTATAPRLERLLSGTDLVDQYFSPADTFANIRNSIANVMVELQPVAALWERREPKISLKEWVTRGDSIIVLGGKEDLQASLEPINRVMFKMIAEAFLAERESPQISRLWFFCDELKTAGRLDSLPRLMNARSKGVRCVLGFQDLEGLVETYRSAETAKEILNRCTTVSWLKLTSRDTANWASERSGEFERFEYLDTQTKDGSSTSEHLTKREGIMPSEFLGLPDFSGGVAHGFHLIKGIRGVFPSSAHYAFPPKAAIPDFDPRPDAEQLLTPWNDSDDTWLDGGPTKPPDGPKPGPQPPKPDAKEVGRIDFSRGREKRPPPK